MRFAQNTGCWDACLFLNSTLQHHSASKAYRRQWNTIKCRVSLWTSIVERVSVTDMMDDKPVSFGVEIRVLQCTFSTPQTQKLSVWAPGGTPMCFAFVVALFHVCLWSFITSEPSFDFFCKHSFAQSRSLNMGDVGKWPHDNTDASKFKCPRSDEDSLFPTELFICLCFCLSADGFVSVHCAIAHRDRSPLYISGKDQSLY